MNRGVPQMRKSPPGDRLAVSQRPFLRVTGNTFRAALPVLGSVYALTFASSALGETAAGRTGPATHPSSRSSGGQAGCMGHSSGGGSESGGAKETPAVVKETPSDAKETAVGGASTPSVAAPAAVPAAVPAALPAAPPPTVKASTTPKRAEKRTTKRTTKRSARKHHPRSGETTARTLARSPLPNKRAAFTG